MTYSSVDKLVARCRSKVERSAEDSDGGAESIWTDGASGHDVGTLASVACSLLMKVLLVARLARPGLL